MNKVALSAFFAGDLLYPVAGGPQILWTIYPAYLGGQSALRFFIIGHFVFDVDFLLIHGPAFFIGSHARASSRQLAVSLVVGF